MAELAIAAGVGIVAAKVPWRRHLDGARGFVSKLGKEMRERRDKARRRRAGVQLHPGDDRFMKRVSSLDDSVANNEELEEIFKADGDLKKALQNLAKDMQSPIARATIHQSYASSRRSLGSIPASLGGAIEVDSQNANVSSLAVKISNNLKNIIELEGVKLSHNARVMLKNVSTTILKKDIYKANLIDRKVEAAMSKAEGAPLQPLDGMEGAAAPTDFGLDQELEDWLAQQYSLGKEHKPIGSPRDGPKDKRAKFQRSSTFASKIEGDPKVVKCLSARLTWDDFDIFKLAKATNNKPLATLGLRVLVDHNLPSTYNINRSSLLNFLDTIEEGYKDVPYHNRTHAADVLQACHYFITVGNMKKWLTDLEIFALCIACIIHDYKHPGVNNAFLVNSGSPLALTYNDKGVLENYHVSQAYEVMTKPNTGILSGMSKEEHVEFRRLLVELVLATDMAHHFSYVTKFQQKVAVGLDTSSQEDRLLIMKMAIKASDISSGARKNHFNKQWSERIIEEFFRQGDKERDIDIPVSPLCDRNLTNVAKAQVGFIDIVLTPLYKAWAEFLPEAKKTCMPLVHKNRQYWADMLESTT